MHFDTSLDAVYYWYAPESELFDKWGRLILPGHNIHWNSSCPASGSQFLDHILAALLKPKNLTRHICTHLSMGVTPPLDWDDGIYSIILRAIYVHHISSPLITFQEQIPRRGTKGFFLKFLDFFFVFFFLFFFFFSSDLPIDLISWTGCLNSIQSIHILYRPSNSLPRSKSLEEELEEEQKQQSQIQTDLDSSKDQCAHTERLFHQSQRESEQKIDELTRINQHIPVSRGLAFFGGQDTRKYSPGPYNNKWIQN